MTTFFPFLPPPNGVFTFQPTLDGSQYTATVAWNLFGARYYLALAALDGTEVFNLPVIESPAGINVQTLSWSHGQAVAVADEPHGFDPGSTTRVVVTGCSPDAYNGTVDAFALDAFTLQWPIASNPGAATKVGAISYTINLAGGYFETSSLAFRNQSFEVAP